MENVFENGVRMYAGSWQVTSTRNFNEAEKNAITRNVVVHKVSPKGDFGLSVCFFMKNGKQAFISLSRDSQLTEGESVNVNTCTLLTLERDGETCLRIKE